MSTTESSPATNDPRADNPGAGIAPVKRPWTTLNKVGLALTILLAAGNITSVAGPTPEGEVGPPLAILAAGSALGVIGVAAGIIAWVKGSRAAARLAAITIVLCMLSALPAFFVPVPATVKALVAAVVVATVAAVVLTFTGRRRTA